MLQQLESGVQLMDQHLKTLLRDVLTRQAMEEDRGGLRKFGQYDKW